MTLRRIATFTAAVPLLLALDRDARACSVCLAGDPLFSAHGTTAQEVGNFSLYLEALGFRKESGLLPHQEPEHEEHGDHAGEEHEDQEGEERSSGQRIEAFLAWTPIDRLTLTLGVPWAFHEIEEDEDGETTRSTLSGLGDVSLAATAVLWRDRDVLPATWIEGRLWLKTPTGPSDRKVDGVRDPHLQTGTGSWDFGAGLAAVHRLAWGSLYGSAFYRENTEGDLDYEYGDVILANAGLEVPVGHAFPSTGLDWLTLGLEMNFRYAEYDLANGERYRDSGGAILYATPVVRIRLPFGVSERPVSLRLAVQLPLVQTWLHNTQREREVWSAGVLIPF